LPGSDASTELALSLKENGSAFKFLISSNLSRYWLSNPYFIPSASIGEPGDVFCFELVWCLGLTGEVWLLLLTNFISSIGKFAGLLPPTRPLPASLGTFAIRAVKSEFPLTLEAGDM
jgi:hypothetical protein